VLVIFGATGDLAQRKILPALARLERDGKLPKTLQIVGVARRQEHDDASYRQWAAGAISQGPDDEANALLPRIYFQSIGDESSERFQALEARLKELERKHELPGPRFYYLALPPQSLQHTVLSLGHSQPGTRGATRLVIEKPFGHDLDSARRLNQMLHQRFDESEIYRIDHYLGKDTVQNLLVLRFANPLLESVWNRDRIESVHLLVAESLGVGSRADYYDRNGALRDMVQNHLTQLLSLVAMEAPSSMLADAIRFEKAKVLRAASLDLEDSFFARYQRAGETPGYLEEKGVSEDSRTETFVSLKLQIDNWRWQGVPFYLSTGKRLPQRLTRIRVKFKRAPVCLFESMGTCMLSSNVLDINLQPDEGFEMHIDVKVPGSPMRLQSIPLAFQYASRFDLMPEAYETLLLDVLKGDQTLFVHAEESELSWSLYAPLLEQTQRKLLDYPAGSWGPEDAALHLAL
jgi:glucose-6-phosphate 1-dehydrogenase